jgi:hypothetical protein
MSGRKRMITARHRRSVHVTTSRARPRGPLAILLFLACGSSVPQPLGERVGPLLGAALSAAEHARDPWRCAAPDTPSLTDETLAVGGRTWKLAGHTVHGIEGGDLAIGVIADAGGAPPPTLSALRRLRDKLETTGPALVISLGGMGASQNELEATLGALAEQAPWPVIALPGDLEPVEAHANAIAVLRKRGAPVIDGRLVRQIEAGGVTIATIPGAGALARLPAGPDGCVYRTADVAAAIAELRDRPGLRVLASFEAPRLRLDGDATGVARKTPPAASSVPASGGELAVDGVDIALHAPLSAAPSPPATGRRGGHYVALTPGTSDMVPRLPESHGATAGVLVVRGDAWSWKPIVDGE